METASVKVEGLQRLLTSLKRKAKASDAELKKAQVDPQSPFTALYAALKEMPRFAQSADV